MSSQMSFAVLTQQAFVECGALLRNLEHDNVECLALLFYSVVSVDYEAPVTNLYRLTFYYFI